MCIPHISHKRRKRRLWKFFSSITCEGNFLTINAKSTKVLKSSCVILRGKIPWPKMRVWKKMTNMRYGHCMMKIGPNEKKQDHLRWNSTWE